MEPTALSMRERMRLDALFVRVRRGDHYEVLGVAPDATDAAIAEAHEGVRAFLHALLGPDRDLGEHRVRAEAVARAVENAWRIVGNARERLRYDQRQSSAAGSSPPERAPVSGETASPVKETVRRLRSEAVLPAHLLAALEAALGVVLRRNVELRSFAGGSLNLQDPAPAVSAAEAAEREERWFDAALWWHLAALASPTDPTPFLRAASALRRGGVPSSFERYQSVVKHSAVFGVAGSGDDSEGRR